MPTTVPVTASNSSTNKAKFNMNQKINPFTVGNVPGLQEDITMFPEHILQLIRATFEKSDSDLLSIGNEVTGFSTAHINTNKGFFAKDAEVYYKEDLLLAPSSAAWWGIYEIELVIEEANPQPLEFYDVAKKLVFQETGNTRYAHVVKVYEKYETSESFPTVTSGRIEWLRYKKTLPGGGVLTEVTNLLESNRTVLKSDIVDNLLSTAANKPLSANQGNVIKAFLDAIFLILESNDINLDEFQEIVNYIKALGTDKANKSDIVDNLTTNDSTKMLAASQGVAIKAITDALNSGKVNIADIVNVLTSTDSTKPLSALQGKILKDLIDGIPTYVPTPTDLYVGVMTDWVDYVPSAITGLGVSTPPTLVYARWRRLGQNMEIKIRILVNVVDVANPVIHIQIPDSYVVGGVGDSAFFVPYGSWVKTGVQDRWTKPVLAAKDQPYLHLALATSDANGEFSPQPNTTTLNSVPVVLVGAGETFELSVNVPISGWLSNSVVPYTDIINLQNNKVDKVVGKGLSTTDVTIEMIEVNSIPIGSPFPQWFDGNLASVVAKYPTRFIKLSKDSAYNTGKLTSQTAHTADETTFYTATISDATSPLDGQSVTLINSTENTTGGVSAQPAFLGAGETSQSRLVNRLQGFKITQGVNPPDNMLVDVGTTELVMQYASSDLTPVSDSVNGTPRQGKTTRPDTVTAVYYMRIK